MNMKRMTFILATLFGLGSMSGTVAQDAKNIIPGVSINHFEMERNGKYLSVEMGMDLTELDVETNRAVLLTPRLVNGADSTDLPSVGIYGRRRYFYYIRNGIGSISGTDETTLRASKMPKNMDYNNSVVYEEWMDGATHNFHRPSLPPGTGVHTSQSRNRKKPFAVGFGIHRLSSRPNGDLSRIPPQHS